MFGSEYLQTLLNVSTITNLIDSYGTGKALFSGHLIPQACTVQKTINFYQTTSFNGGDPTNIYLYTVNCRAKTYGESRTIANAVLSGVNRVSTTLCYAVCEVFPTLPPADDTDNYNTPVGVTIKER